MKKFLVICIAALAGFAGRQIYGLTTSHAKAEAQKVVRAQEILLVDEKGQVRARLANNLNVQEVSEIEVFDGTEIGSLLGPASGTGGFFFNNSKGEGCIHSQCFLRQAKPPTFRRNRHPSISSRFSEPNQPMPCPDRFGHADDSLESTVRARG